jgi:hypothetical protein
MLVMCPAPGFRKGLRVSSAADAVRSAPAGIRGWIGNVGYRVLRPWWRFWER